MADYRVTVTGNGVELRGHVASFETLAELATAVRPFDWLITASPVLEVAAEKPGFVCTCGHPGAGCSCRRGYFDA